MTPTQLLQQCKDEVAVKRGYMNYTNFLDDVDMRHLGHSFIDDVINEAALLFAKKMCEKQREICAVESCVHKSYEHDNILNAPLATEE